jgi:hypothetical protein
VLLKLIKSEDIQDKINDNCILISYIKVDVGYPDDIKSLISILCKEDKQEYLNKLRKWQKNFKEELEKKAILSRLPECGAMIESAWIDFWAELKPDRSKNYLKDIPKLDIQFLDQEGVWGTVSLVIKGELEEFKNNEDPMLVNYIHVDFGDEIILTGYDKVKFHRPCSVKNFSIKNKIAIMCKGDKKEYLKRVGKWQQKYLSEYVESPHVRDDDFYSWIHNIWNNLEPNKNLKEQIPFLDVHNMALDENTINGLKIEVKGEINHLWEFPNDYPIEPWLEAELFDTKDD